MSEGFYCAACGHTHSGRQWAYICVGCPCPERQPPFELDDATGSADYAGVAQDKSAGHGNPEDGRTQPPEAQGTEPERLTRPGATVETVPLAPSPAAVASPSSRDADFTTRLIADLTAKALRLERERDTLREAANALADRAQQAEAALAKDREDLQVAWSNLAKEEKAHGALRDGLATLHTEWTLGRLVNELYYRNDDAGPRDGFRLCAECDRQGTPNEPHVETCKVGRLERKWAKVAALLKDQP